ncbi:FecR family protein [Spirosoma luteum]|uniref:FecR family protein n=1 Tax=Spirosoma luteum TaxID=431553 RepID=UPI0003730D31|nr:FecR domain-containing protein [Spirosoma luteum]
MEDIVNKAVLFDYFSGRVSPLQKKSVESWLDGAGNRDLYYQWLHEWEMSRLQVTANWQYAYGKTMSRMNNSADGPQMEKQQPNRRETGIVRQWINRSWLIAASLLLTLAVCGWLFRDALFYKTVRTGFGETRSLTLPDGSTIVLNANSSLRFLRFGFGEWTLLPDASYQSLRTVELVGEADFSIRHLPNHQPFIVMTPKGVTILVLGTQFTVFSRARATRVALRSGSIRLTSHEKNERPLLMHPGDLAVLNEQGKLALTRTPHPETMASWKNHRFSFELTPLREIADILRENYGLTVVIKNPQLANRTISGSFTARNANEVLQLIAQLLQINYARDNNHVSFTD